LVLPVLSLHELSHLVCVLRHGVFPPVSGLGHAVMGRHSSAISLCELCHPMALPPVCSTCLLVHTQAASSPVCRCTEARLSLGAHLGEQVPSCKVCLFTFLSNAKFSRMIGPLYGPIRSCHRRETLHGAACSALCKDLFPASGHSELPSLGPIHPFPTTASDVPYTLPEHTGQHISWL
jgi:hypothetical protein